jgi:UTP--glucose-1-phosphate uridylyltransferase
VLEKTEPGKGGEIQLTDALQKMAQAPEWTGGVYGVVFRGRRYDTGDRLDYIKAIVQLAVDREDLGPALRPWLKTFVADLDEGPKSDDIVEEMPVPVGDGVDTGR